jgi:hypothetical protein
VERVAFISTHLSDGDDGRQRRLLQALGVARALLDAREEGGTGSGDTHPQTDPSSRSDHVLHGRRLAEVRKIPVRVPPPGDFAVAGCASGGVGCSYSAPRRAHRGMAAAGCSSSFKAASAPRPMFATRANHAGQPVPTGSSAVATRDRRGQARSIWARTRSPVWGVRSSTCQEPLRTVPHGRGTAPDRFGEQASARIDAPTML